MQQLTGIASSSKQAYSKTALEGSAKMPRGVLNFELQEALYV
jgi:hypothetical protein